MKELVILGAGTAGTMMANKLVRALPDDWRVTLVDRDDVHVYQPGLLFVPFGASRPDELVRPRTRLVDPGVRTILSAIDRVDPEARKVALADGTKLDFDLLVVATGAEVRPEETPGLTGRFWREDVHDFYTLEGATALAKRLDRWEGGRLVIDIVDLPIKCPVAPLELAFLADAWLTERGLRDKTEIVFVTPLDGAFTRPVASRILGGLLESRGIRTEVDYSLAELDADKRIMRSFDGRELDYDLLVTVPLHGGTAPVRDSQLGDPMGFVPTDKHTLRSRDFENVFVIGDATDLPISKAGAVAHFQGDVLLDNLLRAAEGRPPEPGYDGHANCFVETGYGRAMLLDFNYETEPLPGRFPLPALGPFTLLEESRVNHWGKMAFRWMYWNVLVKGDPLPLDHRMVMHGKRSA